MLSHGLRKSTIHDLIGKILRKIKISFLGSLSDTHVPQIIINYICIIQIRPDIEGIMRLQNIRDIRLHVFYDCSGKQHTTGLAADHTGSDHMISHCKIVLRSEMLLDHLTHLLISGHHDITHSGAFFRHIHAIFIHEFGSIEESVPRIRILLLGRPLRQSERLIKPAGFHAVEYRSELPVLRIIRMRKEHGIGISVPDLLRTHVNILFICVNIEEKLGCI